MTFEILFLILLFFIQFSTSFNLTIIHINDFHSRLNEINQFGGDCNEELSEIGKCFGGFGRILTKVNQIREKNNHTLFLCAGDYFQGNALYTIFGWRIIAHFFNTINLTALAIGVHELDDGPEELVKFLTAIKHPVLSANIDFTRFPDLKDKFQKYLTVNFDEDEDNNRTIAIIGYTSKETLFLSSPGPIDISDEIDAIRECSEFLHEVMNVSIIIAMGHGGFELDKKIAKLRYIDIVVGGKTNTFLYTGNPPSNENSNGPYPFVVNKKKGSKIALVVQAYQFGKYLGVLQVKFDENNNIVSFNGNPILLDNTIEPDKEVSEELQEWVANMTIALKKNVGESKVFLDGRRSICGKKECNFGNILADAVVYLGMNYASDFEWNYISIAAIHAGGFNGYYDEKLKNGVITLEDLYSILPYRNQIDFIELKGDALKQIFEFSIENYEKNTPTPKFLQVSGVKIVYDICKPVGSRVRDLQLLCNDCRLPNYYPLREDQFYRIVVPNYLIQGGDGYQIIKDSYISHQSTGEIDSNILLAYLNGRGSLMTGVEDRIKIYDEECTKSHAKANVNCIRKKLFIFTLFLIFWFT